jgi:hypothetical protein
VLGLGEIGGAVELHASVLVLPTPDLKIRIEDILLQITHPNKCAKQRDADVLGAALTRL